MLKILLLSGLLFYPHPSFCQTAYIDTTFAQVPLTFTMNQGQFLPQIKFIAEGNNENLTMKDIEDSSYTYIDDGYQYGPVEKMASVSATSDSIYLKLYSFMEFYNINQNPEFVTENPSSWNSNYFIGNNRDDWVIDVPNYAKIIHVNLYNGIDLQYTAEKRRMTYDIIVHKGADPSQIQFKLPSRSWENGGIVSYSTRILMTTKSWYNPPDCFQYIDGKEIKIDLKYKEIGRINGKDNLGNNVVYVIAGYDIGAYNPDYDLHIKTKYIDEISYTGKRTIRSITGMDVDNSGNVYATGEGGSGEIVQINSTKIYIMKLKAASGMPEFVSYIIADIGTVNNPIKTDSLGNVYTAGIVRPNTNFPITENAYDNNNEYEKCFILKLNSTGNKIEYSTFLGGNGYDLVYDIDIDNYSNIYIAGVTNSTNYPVSPGAYDTVYLNDTEMGFITKINLDSNKLVYSTFLKWADTTDIFIDNDGYAYLTGVTGSYKFPITEGSYNYYYNKSLTKDYQSDVFVTKLDKDGKNLIFSTHFGSQGNDSGNAIKVNDSGEIFIAGSTGSPNFPTTQDAFDDSFNGGDRDAFLTKMNSDGSDLIYSTFVGGSGNDSFLGFGFDTSEDIFINGYTRSSDFPITPDAFMKTRFGDWDLVLMKFETKTNRIIYSTFLGGKSSDLSDFGLKISNKNEIIIGTRSSSTDFLSKNTLFDSGSADNPYLIKFILGYDTNVENTELNPVNFQLYRPYPNPFNPTTTISFFLDKKSKISLDIFNIMGQKVKTLYDGNMEKGKYSILLDASGLSSGIYFCRMKVDNKLLSRKILLLK